MKLRFENIKTIIAGDPTRSPWVGLLMLVVMTWAVIPFSAGAQYSPSGAIEIEQGGELWIEGSASVVDYTCEAEELSGNGNIENTTRPEENVNGHGDVSIAVSIPVKTLECGKRAMNKDMYNALKADKFRSIHYRLLEAVRVDQDSPEAISASPMSTNGHRGPNGSNGNGNSFAGAEDEGQWMDIKTTGILEIAGVQDTTVVYVKGKLVSGNRFQVRGSKHINMDTYNIKPPTALMGLIKASKDLTVHFNVTVRLKD